jgi:cell wall-associated NlpC family hydrolase
MPALIDLYSKTRQLPLRERIVGIAWLYVGTPYGFGEKSARPLDGAHGVGKVRKIDCSGFVRNVYDEVFPEQGLSARYDLNVATFRVVDLFEDVTEPQAGDIVCWDAHMGIVYNTERKEFIHAPHTGDHVRIAEYGSGYWGGLPKMFRRWKNLQ